MRFLSREGKIFTDGIIFSWVSESGERNQIESFGIFLKYGHQIYWRTTRDRTSHNEVQ